jgi:hypothetical protein
MAVPDGESSQCYICVTCGTQYAPAFQPPQRCEICTDARQFVGLDGQQWTTLPQLKSTHRNNIWMEESGLYSIASEPAFGIGERAFLLQTPRGNVLWDCITLVDDETIRAINNLGGVAAIAISHPHYYTSMIDWSVAFNNAPIYLHSNNRKWVARPHENIRFWSGDSEPLLDHTTLILTPGHFDGYQVLHWPAGAGGKGALLSGDQPQVCMDLRWVSFMYSYPNYIPLGGPTVREIVRRLGAWKFDRIYGAFPRRTVSTNAQRVVERSAERYLKAICA